MRLFIVFFIIIAGVCSCSNNPAPLGKDITEKAPATTVINYAVTKFFPHDTSLYTEGLLVNNGQLLESTGSPEDHPQTKSVIGITDLATGKFDQKVEINKSKYFGEGIVVFNNRIYQLTYTNQIGFIYDRKSFKQTGQFKYDNKQGWSLTTNDKDLIMSDGTDKLTFFDPDSMKPVRVLPVTENGLPVEKLNELEYIKGNIYANIWLTDFIVRIDPSNGKVTGRLDLTSLAYEAKNKYPGAEVLNGIAYDSATDKIYVTGKLWPNIYQVEFTH